MPNRLIKSRSRSASVQLAEGLQSLLALELLQPSRQLYLISPWISNVALLTSHYGQFRPLLPELDQGSLGLAPLLGLLSERGTRVRVVCRPGQPHTEEFLRRLPPTVPYRYDERLHEKGMLTEQVYLRGSMNFTYYGVNLNEEHVELTTDSEEIGLALLEAERTWSQLDDPDSLR